MLDNIKSWWSALADRERLMVGVGGIFVGVFVIYSGIWSPLSTTVSDYKFQVQSQRALLAYLQNAAVKINALRAEGVQASIGAASQEGLLSVVEQSVKQHKLSSYLKQVEQPEGGQVLLTFENAPLDQTMGWLQQLLATQNVKIVSVTATRLPTSGAANLKIILSQ